MRPIQSVFDRTERLLGLQVQPHLAFWFRLRRLLTAIWFRPYSWTPPNYRPIRRGLLTRAFYRTIKVLALAFWDLFKPIAKVMALFLYPLKWINDLVNLLADLTFKVCNPAPGLTKLGAVVAKKSWLAVFWGLLCLVLFLFAAQATLPLAGQLVFVLTCYIFAQFFRRLPKRMANLCLIALTVLVLSRYVFWRVTASMDLESGMETVLGYTLLAAEFYTWVILFLGFAQVLWPLERKPIQLQSLPEEWPNVDVFIPTYNEPLSVVKPTVYAAKGLDWPADKITVYILDDGHRPDFEAFALQAGVEYISRPDNSHAKAGNINYALKQTGGEFIAIFDCDHIPCRSFLQTTMGWMLSSDKVSLVQTPHHFFSADPFEKNYDMFRKVPNEGELFYGLLQDGNDFWNATFFCGSCAVIRRKALEEVGGIAVETVTEDAHTSLKMHSLGYESVYLSTAQAAGLATESLAGHIGQRIRWARGMAQIFRTDNPFLKKGLSLFQRICYSNAMLHFFYGIPRLIFLCMPGAYLFFEYHVINAMALTIVSYALPQLMFASYTNSVIQGKWRKSFYSEVYETVLSWYIVLPTTFAFINPRYGKFNVTSKGGLIEQSYFDSNIARPYLMLMIFNLFALGIGLIRLFVWNTHETGTVLMNLGWATFNLILLGAAVGVATEAPQKSTFHRVRMAIPVFLRTPGGYSLNCFTKDYSAGGLGLSVHNAEELRQFSEVQVGLQRGDREFLFPATLQIHPDGHVDALFKNLSTEQEAQLIQCTFGRADAWLNWQENLQRDKALEGFLDVIRKGLVGYQRLFGWIGELSVAVSRKLTADKDKDVELF